MARTLPTFSVADMLLSAKVRASMRHQSHKDPVTARGLRVEKGTTSDRLATMLKLSRCGRLPYGNFTKPELLGFCQARGTKVNAKGLKRNVVAALERADANARLGYFFKLPAEMRLLIVEAAGVKYEVVEEPVEGDV
ncbi:hypothetical protein LTS10_007894 [Elasticomyces elasticus]|nr:hypothetical protein LTS10_007894 [Elasticomyces elasticus]